MFYFTYARKAKHQHTHTHKHIMSNRYNIFARVIFFILLFERWWDLRQKKIILIYWLDYIRIQQTHTFVPVFYVSNVCWLERDHQRIIDFMETHRDTNKYPYMVLCIIYIVNWRNDSFFPLSRANTIDWWQYYQLGSGYTPDVNSQWPHIEKKHFYAVYKYFFFSLLVGLASPSFPVLKKRKNSTIQGAHGWFLHISFSIFCDR